MENYDIFKVSFGIQSNRTIKCDNKLGKLIDLERRFEVESKKIKITEFGSRFTEKSTSEVDRNFRTR